MADFCKECSLEHFGKDYGDLSGLCDPGFKVEVICEGCGFVTVDHEGKRVDSDPHIHTEMNKNPHAVALGRQGGLARRGKPGRKLSSEEARRIRSLRKPKTPERNE